MAKNESSRVIRPLQSVCRRISTGLIAPVVRGVRGAKRESSRSEMRLPGVAHTSSPVQDSPPQSPRSRRERKKGACGNPVTVTTPTCRMKNRKKQSGLFAKTYKVAMLGQGGVGKSALTVQFISHRFLWDYDPTLEDTYVKFFSVDQEPCRLEVLDTAQQSSESASLAERYEITSDGFIIVYSITDKFSYNQAQEIIQRIKKRRRRGSDLSDGVIALVGNKLDLIHQRQVSADIAKEFAKTHGCLFMEVTAADGHNGIDGVFTEVVRKIREVQCMLTKGIKSSILLDTELVKRLDSSVRQVFSFENLTTL